MWFAMIRLRHDWFRLALPVPMIVVWLLLLCAAMLFLLLPGRGWRLRARGPGLVWDCMFHCSGTHIGVRSRDGTEVMLDLV
jgi:hypothetical protein